MNAVLSEGLGECDISWSDRSGGIWRLVSWVWPVCGWCCLLLCCRLLIGRIFRLLKMWISWKFRNFAAVIRVLQLAVVAGAWLQDNYLDNRF